MLKGEMCYLRELREGDMPALLEWMNDSESTRLMYTGRVPVSPEALKKELHREQCRGSAVIFAICSLQEEFIGTTGLYSIRQIDRTAELRIFIGDLEYRYKGIGTEATRMLIKYGFQTLNLHRIWLGVNKGNEAAIKLYEKIGFKHEGVLREEFYGEGKRWDIIRFGLLREEIDA